MASVADLLGSIATLLWVIFAFAIIAIFYQVLKTNRSPLAKFGLGPTGVTVEFAEAKLDEVIQRSDEQTRDAFGTAAKRSVIDRLQRNSDLLRRARILWVDDHPENNSRSSICCVATGRVWMRHAPIARPSPC